MVSDTLKSVWAVLAGFLSVAILSIATDTILEKIGIFPPITEGLFVTWMLGLALTYRMIYTILGGYIVAYLAPSNPIKHATILAGIGTFFALVGVVVGWNLSQHWYPIALVITAYPCIWLGAKLKIGFGKTQ